MENAAGRQPSIVQVMDSVGLARGGLTRAVFKRLRHLTREYRSCILTVAPQGDAQKNIDLLKKAGDVPASTRHTNFHEDLRCHSTTSELPLRMPHVEWESGSEFASTVERIGATTTRRYYRSGTFVGLTHARSDDKLQHVDVHDVDRPWLRLWRDRFDSAGEILAREYYDEAGQIRYRIYTTTDAKPYLSTWVSTGGYEYRTVRYESTGSTLNADMRQANQVWLIDLLKNMGPTVVFTDEPRTSFALGVDLTNTYHVASIHTTHFKNNRDSADGNKQWLSHYIESAANVGKFVLFTDRQRAEILPELSVTRDSVAVVPHAAPLEVIDAKAAEDKGLDVVTVARLADSKRIDDVVEAFSISCKNIDGARLRILGRGPAEGRLRELVRRLGLEDKVLFEGHVDNVLETLSTAACSVFASQFEGFGLVVTESMAVGTPVIAYDVPYGPSEIIEHGVSGLLVEDGAVESLAEAMERVLRDERLRVELSRNALMRAQHYSEEAWQEGWSTLVAEAFAAIAKREPNWLALP